MSRHLVLLTGAALVALHTQLAAQSLAGHLSDGAGRALAGAHVVLVAQDGARVDATLTDALGAFTLTASSAGRYALRGEAIGYGVAAAEMTLGGDTAGIRLLAEPLVLDVPTAALLPDRRCRLPGNGAARIASLWIEVRKALRATSLAEDAGLHGQERRTWTRQLDPEDLRTLDENVAPVTGFRPGPAFRSPPPEELAQFGFIQGGESEGYSFYAPDTRTLLSSVFTDSHCLGFTSDGPEEGWVGLTFRPRFGGGLDVEGTLWIDAGTLGPQRLEYTYTALPWSVKTDKVGGRVDFHRLDDGPWVVHRWWIRSPRVGVRNVRLTQWDEPRQRFGLSGLVEVGGEVLRVRLSDGSVEGLRQAPPETERQPGPARSDPAAR